jgi:hypothetical protein
MYKVQKTEPSKNYTVMKKIFFIVLKYYAIIGGICASLAGVWVCGLSVKADHIISRGNTVKVRGGPTFAPGCSRVRMGDYFVTCRAFGTFIMTFLMWPLMLHMLITNPRWWCMVEEIKSDE